ncbi:hypothetical protein COV81_04250 [Candidatus Peregrinibacteria bacterium CG11_big_fil_rev_8_21_14_0_20_41_10]|nr:MAG: hypothetical protein COV81_04250 [Candidatus Peregrinibacteria bacterium CG11_big_fil_rev_8_21_14_0_20_41_10]PIZ74548.1 MAG: hypothetical protein COY06_04035 [Candidatus Peregrinibacteria bacterium CG_4_10_14_0_2_um_filter_41_8]PJC38152.1 MAG: hypothetical protein CO045_01785 [Candidatus Peregrinibacteria bacterium CG_4_9_14_0_2_um_filter_41_14]
MTNQNIEKFPDGVESKMKPPNQLTNLQNELEQQKTSQELTKALGGNELLSNYFNTKILPKLSLAQIDINELTASKPAEATKIMAVTLKQVEDDLTTKFPDITEAQKAVLLTLSTKITGNDELTAAMSTKSKLEKVEFVVALLPFGIGTMSNFVNAARGKTISGDEVSRIKELGWGFLFLGVDVASALAALPSGGTSLGANAALHGFAQGTAKNFAKKEVAEVGKGALEAVGKKIGGKKFTTQAGEKVLGKIAGREIANPEDIKAGLRIIAELAESNGKYGKLVAKVTKGTDFMETYPRLVKTVNWGAHKAREHHLEGKIEEGLTAKKAP